MFGLESDQMELAKLWSNSNVFNERLADARFIETKKGVPMLATASASECLIWDIASEANDQPLYMLNSASMDQTL